MTITIFRKWRGETIALFPTFTNAGHCMSYQHIGQHGEADYHYIVRNSRPASPDEYAELKQELERIGYDDLVIRQKSPSWRRLKAES